MKNLMPQDHVLWYLNKKSPKQLRENIKTDVVIVGGGIAGLSAAQRFHEKGCSVVLLEKNYCGAGASGKSSGFITPDSELNLSCFTRSFGLQEAKKLWEFVTSGIQFIEKNIQTFSLNCDYHVQDSVVVANSHKTLAKIKSEHQTRLQLSYDSLWYNKDEISNVIGSSNYYGGLRYSKTFGIDAYQYCQAMKEQLQTRGVKIFEETPVVNVHARGADTLHATVHADHIVVCIDRFIPDIEKLRHDIFHAQTFLMVSAPLPEEDIKKIFPEKNVMVWDTDLIYQYYRIGQGNRFMIGGSDLFSIFWGKEQHNSRKMVEKLQAYTKKHFPKVSLNFEYIWPGLIGVSKDIMPIADHDITAPNIFYISGAAGLPWAAALGCYSADRIMDNNHELDQYFSLKRKFPVGNIAQGILGKRISFALSNLITLHK